MNKPKVPELGMEAVFVPTIHWSIDKNTPTPPVRGHVAYINHRHRTFAVDYPVRLGVLRENFQFADIGTRVRLYK